MEDVIRKRIVGAAVLVFIGVMLPLLLSRCVDDPAPNNQTMHVYEITPSGGIEPIDSSDRPARPPDEGKTPVPADMTVQTPATAPVPPGNSSATSPTTPTAETADTSNSTADAQLVPDAVESASGTESVEEEKPVADSSPQSPNADLSKQAPSGTWVVQVASFAKETNAKAMAEQLDDAYAVFYTSAQVNGETWYRVRVGPFDNDAEANNAAAELRAQGRKTLVVRVE